ncbi:alpha-2Da adrenergic receptor-like [Octopus vulgaris]|uniref:Alpha-2Da adrenergic receptor-like n=1 Tax=Octopus vulgaris TaxID=6645 RepID=A0AA36F8L1_OCTVU|nr:alpha-2Da adrenergic receptor-like [Octopus vulgaris]
MGIPGFFSDTDEEEKSVTKKEKLQGSIAPLYYGSIKKPTNYPDIYSYSCSANNYKKPNYYQLGFFAFYSLLAIVTFVILFILYIIILRHMKDWEKTKCVEQQQNSNGITNIRCPDNIQEKWLNVPEIIDSNQLPSNLSTEDVELSNTKMSSKVSSDEISKVYTKSIAPLRAKLRKTNKERRATDHADRIKRTTITMMMITVIFIVTYLPGIGAMILSAVLKSLNTMSIPSSFFYCTAGYSKQVSGKHAACISRMLVLITMLDRINFLCCEYRCFSFILLSLLLKSCYIYCESPQLPQGSILSVLN